MDLKEKISGLPLKSGVYQFLNSNGKIIYVGKAIKLRNRVRSYFQDNRPRDAKTKALVQHINDVEVIVTDSEAEALILEDTLIKKNKPKYNINLKDDKSYPYIKVTKEKYPRIFYTRNRIKDGSRYIGPITEVGNLKSLMKTLVNLFKIRTCDLDITDASIEKKKHRVCLEFHIEKCEGSCEGLVNQEHYNNNIKKAIKVLLGKTREVEKQFETEMIEASEEMNFEKAAILKNKIQLLREFSSKQKIVSQDFVDRDIFALARVDDMACSIVLKIREGRLIGKRSYIVNDALRSSDNQLLKRTIERWYLETDFIPDELLLHTEPDEIEYLTSWISELKGKSVKMVFPKLGEKKEIISMAETNAKYVLKDYMLAHQKREQVLPRAVLSLQRDLRLDQPPRIIECFDNSHIQGSELVSSLVHFYDGKPKKSEYKKFKNKTVQKNDDFAAMREAVYRRYKRLKEEIKEYNSNPENDKAKSPKFPDVLIIDGGKGQLSAALDSLKELDLIGKFKIYGMAKKLEELFSPGKKDSLILPKTSSSLRLLQQIRDEAHRFAITYHRSLRSKRTFQTELTQVNGIGETTAKKLLKGLGSVEAIQNASENQLKEYLNKKQMIALQEFFGD